MCTNYKQITLKKINMKKTILIIGAIVMMAGFSTRVIAQSGTPSSASNTAGAILIVPLKLLTTHGNWTCRYLYTSNRWDNFIY
jgi:uncharacterized membrane protein